MTDRVRSTALATAVADLRVEHLLAILRRNTYERNAKLGQITNTHKGSRGRTHEQRTHVYDIIEQHRVVHEHVAHTCIA